MTENSLRQAIRRLRQALGDGRNGAIYIETPENTSGSRTEPGFARACAARGKGVQSRLRFPETATTSLGVLQPWPLPSSRLVSQEMAAGMITAPHSAPLAGLLQRVRDEYREMPELKLTKPQATRLFGVAPSVCAAVLRALVRENFLSRTGEGEFVRSTT